MTDITNKRYPSIGQCVYCRLEGTLTDEHAIPFGLGGNLVLPQASCKQCAQITSRFEARILRGGLRGIKERLGLSSRSKGRPEKLPLFCVNGDEAKRVDVAIEHYPALVILPYLAGPEVAAFEGAPQVEQTPWLFIPPPDIDALSSLYGITSWASNSFDTVSFARMLAKIAHCLAIGERGSGSFIPFLSEIILNERGLDFLRFVGSYGAPCEPVAGDLTHKFVLMTEVADGQRYLTCHLRLFASFGAPGYRVVVGQLPEDHNPLLAVPAASPGSDSRAHDWRLMVSASPDPGVGWSPIPSTPLRISGLPRRK